MSPSNVTKFPDCCFQQYNERNQSQTLFQFNFLHQLFLLDIEIIFINSSPVDVFQHDNFLNGIIYICFSFLKIQNNYIARDT